MFCLLVSSYINVSLVVIKLSYLVMRLPAARREKLVPIDRYDGSEGLVGVERVIRRDLEGPNVQKGTRRVSWGLRARYEEI